MTFAQIAVNLPTVTGLYDYLIPPALAGMVRPGHLVVIPFGRQMVQGIVMDVSETSLVADPRPIDSLLDPAPVLTAPQLIFAKKLTESTLGPLSAVLGLFLPTGLARQADTVYHLTPGRNPPAEVSPTARRIVDLLTERGSLRGRQIDRHFAKVDWRKTMQALTRQGWVTSHPVLPPPGVRPKFVRMAQLAVTPKMAQMSFSVLGKTPETLARRQAALQFLMDEPDAVNLSWVYASAGCTLADLQELEERGLIRLFETEIWRDPLGKTSAHDWGMEKREVQLTPEQDSALNEILATINHQSLTTTFLLHGITGSGKTEIYLRAAAETIRRGRQVIVLAPEIALTPQLVRRFLARFPGQVGLVHSKLSEGERYDTWRRARLGLLNVVIGARSALFTPLPNPGLIIVDECHDSSYYQSDPPFYHAVSAAQMFARQAGAACVLGSATPPVAMRYRAGQFAPQPGDAPARENLPHGLEALKGNPLRLLELPRRVPRPGMSDSETGLPPVSIVDMREELKFGNRGIFSRALAENLAETLERGEQAILYLNRRGTATYVFCRSCGYVAECPRCATPLTYHHTTGQAAQSLQCHRCGYSRKMFLQCPQCHGNQVREYGLGSERVEAEVQALLPQARVLRWDWDTTRQKDAHELILAHFANHQADVLVGTQMLAKGLDLPLVTLVGIVLADVGLALPDPFAGERAFQLLTQVAGRAGRSERGGRVILQTFLPDNPVIKAAAGHDYAAFYQYELENRRALAHPPFARLSRLEFRHPDEQKAQAEAERLAGILRERIAGRGLQQASADAVPCFFARQDEQFRWQVILRAVDVYGLLDGLRLDGWRVEVEPVSLL